MAKTSVSMLVTPHVLAAGSGTSEGPLNIEDLFEGRRGGLLSGGDDHALSLKAGATLLT